MKKRPGKDLPYDGCLYVILHAEWRASRGKGPSMPYCGIRNPKKALEVALEDYHFYSDDFDWDESSFDVPLDEDFFDLVGEKIQWTEEDESRCLGSPLLNNFREFASDLEQEDAIVENFFWVVSGENVEDCGMALMILFLHRSNLAERMALEILEAAG